MTVSASDNDPPSEAIEPSTLEEEVFSRLPREAAELVAQLLLEAGDDASVALSHRISDRLGFALAAEAPGGPFGGLPFFAVPDRKRAPPNPSMYQPLAPAEVRDWFREGGRLSDLPGFEHRPEQEKLALAVADASARRWPTSSRPRSGRCAATCRSW